MRVVRPDDTPPEPGDDDAGAFHSAAEHLSRRERHRDRRRRRLQRLRRHGRRAYIQSVYFLPSLATLGNAVCGFGALYIAALLPETHAVDPLTNFFSQHHFTVAAWLIFGAMVFDALDGRLARFARHTTDFGGQLDSLADVISFGVAPAFIALMLIKASYPHVPMNLSRLIWAVGGLYMCCAALRLARFNVSNEHGEQHHFSFLGLPSPAAGGTVAAWILMQQDLMHSAFEFGDTGWGQLVGHLASACVLLLPVAVLLTGLLMVSHIRYPHLVNKYLRGKRSIGQLLFVLGGLALLMFAPEYAIALGMTAYVLSGVIASTPRLLRRPKAIG